MTAVARFRMVSASGRSAVRGARLKDAISTYALSAPAFLLLVALILLPATAIFVIALTDWQFGERSFRFVGFNNFVEMFADTAFRAAFVNTLIYVAVVVPGTVAGGLAIAILIESGERFRAFYRAAHFIPVMATLSAMSLAWEALLHPTIGMVNQVLGSLGLPGANWLNDPSLVLFSICLIGIWHQLGFAMVLFLAGLKAIPRDLYDAADIDGADSAIDRFLTVTLPLLGPVVMFVLVIVAIRAFQVFETVQILTQGGPNYASEVLLHTLYAESFEYFRTGYGAAVTVVFLVIIVTLTLGQAKILDRKVHY